MPEWSEAGRGDNHVYILCPPNQGAPEKLVGEKHYVGVDSASWFINKQGNWFKDRTASGTLTISMAEGREEYNIALGIFELDKGARTAPVFDRPVLPDRRYQGGVLTFRVSLTSLNRDTAFASVLKSSASASLNIVGGMVETATAVGPQQVLGAAGGALVRGISEALANTAPGREPLFSGAGIELSIRAESFSYPEIYVLFHRGGQLDPNLLKTALYGQTRIATYDNKPLEDGAWLLLRLRRTEVYSGVRSWFDDERRLRAAFDDLVSDVAYGSRTRAEALAQLAPGDGANSTLYDDFVGLRRQIRTDGVLTVSDAKGRVDELSKARSAVAMRIREMGTAPEAPAASKTTAAADVLSSAASAVLSMATVNEAEWQNVEAVIDTHLPAVSN